MTPRRLQLRVSVILDLLVWFALVGTREISDKALLVFAGVSVLLMILKRLFKREALLPQWVIVIGMIALLSVMIVFAFRSNLVLLVIAAHAILPLLLFLQASGRTRRTQLTRLAVHFVALLICAALTPDFYLAGVILCFVLLGCLLLSAAFLEREYELYAKDWVQKPLPRTFYTHVFGLSVLVLIFSLILFPILPRTQKDFGISWGRSLALSQTGYSEEIDLASGIHWGPKTTGVKVLRIVLDEEMGQNLQLYFPLKLLRGRSLDYFNGSRWIAGVSKKSTISSAPLPPSSASLTFLLSPLGTQALIVPYRTASVQTDNFQFRLTPFRTTNGNWTLPGVRTRELSYEVNLGGTLLESSPPTSAHLSFPSKWKKEKWQEIAKKVFAGATTPIQKIERIARWMRYGFFKPRYLDRTLPESQVGTSEAAQKTLENFLFKDHAGHCELFASSAALLLRLAGIPARVVSGFRIQRPPVQDVLLIQSDDAHAWVEAWDTGRAAWVPIDPTPMVLSPFEKGFFERLSYVKDSMEVFWLRQVIDFRKPSDYRFVSALFWVSLLLLASSIAVSLYRRRNPWEASWRLRWRRMRVERWERMELSRKDRARGWWEKYKALRFGSQGTLRDLDQEWKLIQRS